MIESSLNKRHFYKAFQNFWIEFVGNLGKQEHIT